MQLLNKASLKERLTTSGKKALFIDPLLEESQIGEISIDLRLGYDFLVPVLTRKPFISLTSADEDFRGMESYYQPTRREIGDKFVLYPGQVVLTTTLEYFSLPTDVYSDIVARSSYARMGMHFGTMMQPGYRGCFPLELVNGNTNPIELIVGSRIVQARFFEIGLDTDYNSPIEPRKYFGTTRPVVSRAAYDVDIQKLIGIADRRNA